LRAGFFALLAFGPEVLLTPRPAPAQALPIFRNFEAGRQEPVNVSGREFVYDYKTDTIVVRGNALLTQGATVLKADEIEYARGRRAARALGHVHLADPMVDLRASQAELEMENESGRLLDAQVRVQDGSYRLAGKEIRKLAGQRYSIRDGYFTTCGCEEGKASWSIAADEINVHLGQTGTARGARFNILGWPILKLPYASFPADSDRSSGLLSPRMGQSRLRGFQYVQPLYLVINQSSDATIATDVETAARVGVLSEYRLQNGDDDYLRFNAGYFDESLRENRTNDVVDTQIADPHVPLNRYQLIGLSRQHLTRDLTLFGDTVAVSDSLYLREMNIYTLSRGYGSSFGVLRDATSHFGLLESFEDGFARLAGLWNEDLIQDQRFALQTLPALLMSGRRELPGGFAYSDYDVEADNFWRTDGIGGWRLDLNPRLTVPWRFGDYLIGYAAMGARETAYDASGRDIDVIPVGTAGFSNNNGLSLGALNQGGLQTRELAYFGAGASSVIERVYDFNGDSIRGFKHTIEPLVSYAYVPRISQGRLPLFDEVDRVNPRNLMTYGVTSRLFIKTAPRGSEAPEPENDNDQEREEESYIEPQAEAYTSGGVREAARLTLLQAYDLSHQVAEDGSHMSDVVLDANVFPTRIAMLGSQTGYNAQEEKITYANVYLSLSPPWATSSRPSLYMGRALEAPFLQIMYNFVGGNAASHTFAARAYYEFFDRIGLYYAPLYDFAGGKLLSSEYGLRLKSRCNCWAFDFGVSDTINPNEVQYQFELTLGGLGSIGHNPFGRNPFYSYYSGGAGVVPSPY
jgi:LPS-assembly protein